MAESESQPKSSSGLAIAGLVLGIIAILTSFLPIINNLSFFIALIGGVFALIALLGALRGKHTAKGMSIAGVVLAVVSVVVVLVTQSAYSAALKSASEELSSGSEPVSSSSSAVESTSAAEDAESAAAEEPKKESKKDADEEATEAKKDDAQAEEEASEADYTHMSVGDSVTLKNGLTVTLNSVQTGLTNYDDSLVIGINVTYTNGGDGNESFSSYDWKGEDASGAQRSERYYSDSSDELNSGTLSPGGSVTGNVYFEDGTVRVLYYGNMFDDSATAGWDIA